MVDADQLEWHGANNFCSKQLLNFFFYPLVVLHGYGVGFLGETGLELPVSIVMLVKGVVPIEVSSLVDCDSYSCNNSSRSSCTAAESSWHGGLKVSGVTFSDIIFFSVTLFVWCVSCWSVESKTAGLWWSNVFSFVKCEVFIGVIRDKYVNRCLTFDLVNAINYVNVWILSFGSTVICKEVCHMCFDNGSTYLDWNHTIVSG